MVCEMEMGMNDEKSIYRDGWVIYKARLRRMVVGYKRSIGIPDCSFSFMHYLFNCHCKFSFRLWSSTPLH